MTFNPNIPAAADLLSNSQQDLLANNGALNAIFSRNHTALDIAANFGKHKFVELPVSAGIPAPVPGLIAGEGTIYTKTVAATSQIFYTPDTTGNEYQLTRTVSASIAKFGTNTALPSANGSGGWTFLPGNLLLQYGSFNPNTSTTVQFPIAFTGVPFTVQLTGVFDNNSTQRIGVSATTVTATQFVFEGSVNTHVNPVYFIAIGV